MTLPSPTADRAPWGTGGGVAVAVADTGTTSRAGGNTVKVRVPHMVPDCGIRGMGEPHVNLAVSTCPY